MFKKVDSRVSFPDLEEKIIKFWQEGDIFGKSLAARADGEPFVFFEGPPSANGRPGIHHVLSRAYKDFFLRYKSMKGYYVPRRAGWDTHGLPVELKVEEEIGAKNKKDIEKFGVEKFNQLCRESVWKYKDEWEQVTQRMGYWLDLENPYVTYDNSYIESAWWALRELWNKGLVYQAKKIVPYCTRCGTALSTHEVAQGYKEVEENSIYVTFKLKGREEYVLVWTTTPWTLPSNAALAIGPDVDYVVAQVGEKKLVLAQKRVSDVLGAGVETTPIAVKELLGLEYEPIMPFFAKEKGAFKIIAGDFVSTDDGSGVVHIAPAFGEDDMRVGILAELPVLQPVDAEGKFTAEVTNWQGKYVRSANPDIIEWLRAEGSLFKEEKYKHDYPYCWRCDSALIYYARSSWFIKMSVFRDELLELNNKINWVPAHIKRGRFGDWLANVDDWAISRERYWGTPLPVWNCEGCGEKVCVGSVAELAELAGRDLGGLDLHKPFVDDIEIKCPKCGKLAKRVKEVMDVWFDSGCMPFAGLHYPFENMEGFKKAFPADYICEGMDQTRGWFYTLHALSTLLFKEAAYKNVICLGLIMDKAGKKMSKSKGNVVDPMEMMQKYGADSVRWHFFTMNQPGETKNFDEKDLGDAVRRVFLILWNTYSFFMTYAEVDGFDPTKNDWEPKRLGALDKWILARLNETKKVVLECADAYDVTKAGRSLEELIGELSTWYVRRSRRRFWKSESDEDKKAAYSTLYKVLKEIAVLMAPFAPFVAEEVYQGLRLKSDPESVHMCNYPKVEEDDFGSILEQMKLVKKVVEVGLSLRAAAKVKVRQPLETLVVVGKYSSDENYVEELEEIVKNELNIKKLIVTEKEPAQMKKFALAEDGGYKFGLDTELTPELVAEGGVRDLVRLIQEKRKEENFVVDARINTVCASGNVQLVENLGRMPNYIDYIKKETLSVGLEFKIEEAVDGWKIDAKEVD